MPRTRKKPRVREPELSAIRSRVLHSRPPLSRFQEIFHAIKAGRFPNRTQLAKIIEVTTKTIQRDLDYMRYQLNLPIEFDYTRGGYYLTKPISDLPLFQLTESELVSIFVAQKAMEAYIGTAFEQPLRTAFQKLQAATKSPDAKVSISWDDLDSGISFRHFGTFLPDAAVFSEIAKSIQNQQVVEFKYKKLDAKVYEKRTVEPWHLACVSGQWYLLGYDRSREARRIFVLARMQSVSATALGITALRPDNPEIQKALPKQLSDLAKRRHQAPASRLVLLRPLRATRPGTKLAFQRTNARVSRRGSRNEANSQFARGNRPLGIIVGERLQGFRSGQTTKEG